MTILRATLLCCAALCLGPLHSQAQPPDELPQYSDADLERMNLRSRRDNYVEWHHKLVDRFNHFLNLLDVFDQTQSIGEKVRKAKKVPSELLEAKTILTRSRLIGSLANRSLEEDALNEVGAQLSKANELLERSEKAWLRWKGLNAADADHRLADHCGIKTQDATAPLKSENLKMIEKLNEQCQVEPRIAISGEIMTYEGMKKPQGHPEKAIQVAVKSVPDAVAAKEPAGFAQKGVIDTSVKTPDKLKPLAPEKKPKQKPLTEQERYQQALAGGSTDRSMPPPKPRPRTAIVNQAIGAVKRWKKGDPLPVDMGGFWLDAEADYAGADAAGKLARTHEEWSQTVEKYKGALSALKNAPVDEQLQKIRELSYQDLWRVYDADRPELSDLLIKHEGNCDARARLFVSLIQSLQVKLPPGKRLLMQFFDGDDDSVPADKRRAPHVQAVIYDQEHDLVWDFVGGGAPTAGTPVPLYDPTVMLNQYLRVQAPDQARPFDDFKVMDATMRSDPTMLAKRGPSLKEPAQPGTPAPKGMGLRGPTVGVAFSNSPNPQHEISEAPRAWGLTSDKSQGKETSYFSKTVGTTPDSSPKKVELLDFHTGKFSGWGERKASIEFNPKMDFTEFEYMTARTSTEEGMERLRKAKSLKELNLIALDLFLEELGGLHGFDDRSRDLWGGDRRRGLEAIVDLEKHPGLFKGEDIAKLERTLIRPSFIEIDGNYHFRMKNGITPQEWRQHVRDHYPLLDEALTAKDKLLERIKKEPYAYGKLLAEGYREDNYRSYLSQAHGFHILASLEQLDAVDFSRTDNLKKGADSLESQNRIDDSRFQPLVAAVLLDPEAVLWDPHADFGKQKKKAKALPKEPKPSPKPSLSASSNEKESLYVGPRYARFAPSPSPSPTPLPTPTETPRFKPRNPIVIKDPLIALSALMDGAPQDRDRALKTLWTPEFANLASTKIFGHTHRASDLDELFNGSSDLDHFRYKLGKDPACEFQGLPRLVKYDHGKPAGPGNALSSIGEMGQCERREVLQLEYFLLKTWLNKNQNLFGGNQFYIPVGANSDKGWYLATPREALEMLDAQLNHKKLPAWFQKIPPSRRGGSP